MAAELRAVGGELYRGETREDSRFKHQTTSDKIPAGKTAEHQPENISTLCQNKTKQKKSMNCLGKSIAQEFKVPQK